MTPWIGSVVRRTKHYKHFGKEHTNTKMSLFARLRREHLARKTQRLEEEIKTSSMALQSMVENGMVPPGMDVVKYLTFHATNPLHSDARRVAAALHLASICWKNNVRLNYNTQVLNLVVEDIKKQAQDFPKVTETLQLVERLLNESIRHSSTNFTDIDKQCRELLPHSIATELVSLG